MIHHFSIAAHHPESVARVLAEILGGRVFHLRPFQGSYIAITGDEQGTAIEVYPLGLELAPGLQTAPARSVTNLHPSDFTATHAAISVSLGEEQIKKIALRESWRAVTCNRTDFQVIEFWVENRIMIEFLTPEMAQDYLRAMAPSRWAANGE